MPEVLSSRCPLLAQSRHAQCADGELVSEQENFRFQRSPRPKQPDQGAANIPHRAAASSDSPSFVSGSGSRQDNGAQAPVRCTKLTKTPHGQPATRRLPNLSARDLTDTSPSVTIYQSIDKSYRPFRLTLLTFVRGKNEVCRQITGRSKPRNRETGRSKPRNREGGNARTALTSHLSCHTDSHPSRVRHTLLAPLRSPTLGVIRWPK
jgi:hypothetical protein